MCVVSMIMEHYGDKWQEYQKPHFIWPSLPAQLPSADEVAEFHRLLERAREYDRKHGEPDCEMAEKKALLRELAKKLGVELNLDAPAVK